MNKKEKLLSEVVILAIHWNVLLELDIIRFIKIAKNWRLLHSDLAYALFYFFYFSKWAPCIPINQAGCVLSRKVCKIIDASRSLKIISIALHIVIF